MNVYQMAILCTLVVGIAIIQYDRITGADVLWYVAAGKPILSALSLQARAVGAATNDKYFEIAYQVIDAAVYATEKAEDMWKQGQLSKEDRNAYAVLIIKGMLNEAGIKVTEQIEQIINGCIALVCLMLPHGVEPKAQEVEA